ncbi:hypothetical protein [Nocardia sp. CC227C]|uniref:hypothetical protein n=1 Tax=Nocardia sp. CC227C TaxID=3044562 RepID=UPI00278C14B3|nr:hypothetical protein [Nocardia sp. CC227C]
MRTVLARIAVRKEELTGHPFLEYIADSSVDPAERLSFAPCIAPFVLGFADVNVLGLRDLDADHDRVQHLVNEHTYKGDHRWPMFLDDLETMGLNHATDRVSMLRELWGPDRQAGRQLVYGLMRLAVTAEPVERIAVVEAVEATGYVAWQSFLTASGDYFDATGRQLRYFGPEHAALETGHAMGGEDIGVELQHIELWDSQRRRALDMVDEVFRLFTAMLTEQLNFLAVADRVKRWPKPGVGTFSWISADGPRAR